MHNDLWHWPISLRSFSYHFAVKLLKYGRSFHVCSTAPGIVDAFFPYLAQTITTMRKHLVHNKLWPWSISSRSFSHDFAMQLLRYNTCWHVCFTTFTVLDGFFPDLAQMTNTMKGYVLMTFDLDLYKFHTVLVGFFTYFSNGIFGNRRYSQNRAVIDLSSCPRKQWELLKLLSWQ